MKTLYNNRWHSREQAFEVVARVWFAVAAEDARPGRELFELARTEFDIERPQARQISERAFAFVKAKQRALLSAGVALRKAA